MYIAVCTMLLGPAVAPSEYDRARVIHTEAPLYVCACIEKMARR